MKKKITILRAGGGTGGHTFPIKSMIEYLDKYHHEHIAQHFWAGSDQSLEQNTALALKKKVKNLTFFSLLSWKWRREKDWGALLKNIRDLFKFMIGVCQAIFFMMRSRVDVIFCKGGYVALPVVIAGRVLRKKIFVHESDTRPGLVNRIASRFSTCNFVAFPQVLKNGIEVWQILSEELIGDSCWKEKKEKTQVLVMWGSQGAKTIYESLLNLLKVENKLQVMDFVIVLGQLNQYLKNQFSAFANVEVRDFCSQKEIGELYDFSDLVITRAGTTSLAEQDLFGLKMIMIPIPWTHDQKNNALWYVNEKKWILIEQDGPDFEEELKSVLIDHIGWHKQEQNIDRLSKISEGKGQIAKILLWL